jgi:type IV secretion system protein VirD4
VSAPPLGPSPLKFGHYCALDHDQPGVPLLSNTERNILIHGLNGAGKSTRLLIELLATTSNRSLLVFDIKGELAWQTALLRRRYGDVFIINPHRMLNLPSHGYNPVNLNPADNRFFSHLTDIGAAAIELSEKDKHWDESAQSLFEGFTGHVIKKARREGRMPALSEVRQAICAPDEFETYRDVYGRRQERLKSGITFTAEQILHGGDPVLTGLVGRFVRKHGLNELASIQSSADTQLKWALDPMIAADMSGAGVDFGAMKQRPTTIYVLIEPFELRKNRRLTRLILSSALRALMRPGPMKTLVILDEFYATVGNLPIVNDIWSLVRGYGIQLMPIVQSYLQLQKLFGDEWANYLAQAGLIVTLGPAGDPFTADAMSKRCGMTTVLQAGFSLSDGINQGDGTSSGTSVGGANQGNSFSRGRSQGGNLSWQQIGRPVLMPQEVMNIRSGHGLIWLPGMGTKTIPFFAPNYYSLRNAPWVRHVRPNPYYSGTSVK